jgi:hypothetical protein
VETSHRPSVHEIRPTSARIFLVVRRAGGDLTPFPGECCCSQQRVENLPSYADWLVIGPVCLSKASVARASAIFEFLSVLGEHFSVPN